MSKDKDRFSTDKVKLEAVPGVEIRILDAEGHAFKLREDKELGVVAPNEAVRYLQYSKPETFAIEVTIAKDFRREFHQGRKENGGLGINVKFDGGETFVLPFVQASRYGNRKYVWTIRTVTLDRNGTSSEVKPKFKQLIINQDNISTDEAAAFAHMGTIQVTLVDVFGVKKRIETAPQRRKQQHGESRRGNRADSDMTFVDEQHPGFHPPTLGDAQEDFSLSRQGLAQSHQNLDATPQNAEELRQNHTETYRKLADDPIPEKGIKGKALSHGISFDEEPGKPRDTATDDDGMSDIDSVLGPEVNGGYTTPEGHFNFSGMHSPHETESGTSTPPEPASSRGRKRPRYEYEYYQKNTSFAVYTFHYRTYDELLGSGIITMEEQWLWMTEAQKFECMTRQGQRIRVLEGGDATVKPEPNVATPLSNARGLIASSMQGSTIDIDSD